MDGMTLSQKVQAHVRSDGPLGVHVVALGGDRINLLSWQQGWWIEIKPTIAELRVCYGPRWEMTEYRPGGIAASAFACGEWEVITWLGSIWQSRRFLQHHLTPIRARINAVRNPAGRPSLFGGSK